MDQWEKLTRILKQLILGEITDLHEFMFDTKDFGWLFYSSDRPYKWNGCLIPFLGISACGSLPLQWSNKVHSTSPSWSVGSKFHHMFIKELVLIMFVNGFWWVWFIATREVKQKCIFSDNPLILNTLRILFTKFYVSRTKITKMCGYKCQINPYVIKTWWNHTAL